jgi:hypothetical protein
VGTLDVTGGDGDGGGGGGGGGGLKMVDVGGERKGRDFLKLRLSAF